MKTVGSRAEVWHGTAKKTSGGLLKKDLKKNKRGRIVSKKMSNRAKKEKRLEKAGYKTKKGVFKKFKAKKRGGENSNNNGVALAAKMFQKANNNYNKNLTTAMLRRVANARPPGSIKTMTPLTYKHMLGFLDKRNLNSLYKVNETRGYLINKEKNNRILNKALIEAVKNGNEKEVKILLKAGADTDVKNIKGETPLYMSAGQGNTDIVKLLLDAGADKDVRLVEYGWTPLHNAAVYGHTDVVKQLLDAGADKDPKDKWGQTPLFHAIEEGYADTVKLLLDSGADKDMKKKHGRTPLHQAAWFGRTDIVKLLLDAGADKEVRAGRAGETPLDYAARYGHTDIMNLLKSHNSKGGSKKRRKRKTTKRKSKK